MVLIREYKSWRVQNVKSPIYPWHMFSRGSGKAGSSAQPQLAVRRNHLGKGYTSHYLPAHRIAALCEDLPTDSNSHAVTVNPVCLPRNRAGNRNTSHSSITLAGLPFTPGTSRITPEGWKSNLFPSTKANLLLSFWQCNYRPVICTWEQVHCSPLRASFA